MGKTASGVSITHQFHFSVYKTFFLEANHMMGWRRTPVFLGSPFISLIMCAKEKRVGGEGAENLPQKQSAGTSRVASAASDAVPPTGAAAAEGVSEGGVPADCSPPTSHRHHTTHFTPALKSPNHAGRTERRTDTRLGGAPLILVVPLSVLKAQKSCIHCLRITVPLWLITPRATDQSYRCALCLLLLAVKIIKGNNTQMN